MKLNLIALTILFASISEARGVYRSLIQSDVTHTIESVHCFDRSSNSLGQDEKVLEVGQINQRLSMAIKTRAGVKESMIKEVVTKNAIQIHANGEGSLSPQKIEFVSLENAKTALTISIEGHYGFTSSREEVGNVLGSTGSLLDQSASIMIDGQKVQSKTLSCDIHFKKN